MMFRLISAVGRLCCKSRKLQSSGFFAKTLSSERSLIRMTSIALPKSPVNFARGREVPRILYAKVAPTARRILVIGEYRFLQQNRPISDLPTAAGDVRSQGLSGSKQSGCRKTGCDPEETWAILIRSDRWSNSARLDRGEDRRCSAPRGAQIHIVELFWLNLLDAWYDSPRNCAPHERLDDGNRPAGVVESPRT
ncbi:hypothetical protein ABID58_005342 [Bradyrhizobium sp. S3.2.6]